MSPSRPGRRPGGRPPAVAFAALAALLASAPGRAPAQPQASADEAERLFREAKPLLDAGRYDEACPKLERSQALDPALGTQFNLADCLEHTGRVARAYELFADVAAIAHAAGRAERERAARERLARLEGQVGFLRLSTESLAALPEAELRRDGEPVPREAWVRPVAVAAGAHRVAASSPRHEGWSTSVDVGARATVELRVPPLRPATLAAAPARTSDAGPTASGPPPGATQRALALAAAGVGVAGLALGATFGAMGGGAASQACAEPAGCAGGASSGRTTVATIGLVAGGLGLGGAAVLWLTAPKRADAAPRQAFNVTPPVGGAPWHVSWRATF